MKLAILRRSATVVAGATAIALASAGAAFAFDSGGNPGATGPNDIEWIGQGAAGAADLTQCSTNQEPNGQPAGTPYLLWVFTTDGGSVATDSTAPHFLPMLHLTGSLTYDTGQTQPLSSNSIHFATPYATPDPSTLHASATFYVTEKGNGSWNLVISHGCAPSGPPPAAALTISKTASGDYTTTWPWSLTKSVDQTKVSDSNGTATFNYTVVAHHGDPVNSGTSVSGDITVTNPNADSVAVTGVSDSLSDGTTCSVDSPPASLPHGDTTLHYTCSPASLDPNNPPTNSATVTWDPQTLQPSGSALAGGHADVGPITIPFTQHKVADSITVSDPNAPNNPLGSVSVNDPNDTQFTYSQSFTDPAGHCTSHDNTAHFTASGGGAPGDSNTVTVTQCVGADLSVSKTANPSFDRTYQWDIHKSVDKSKVDQVGGTVTANYAVTAGETGFSNGNWQVSGKITVSNPNDWEDISLTGLSDAIDNNGSANCTVDTSGDPSLTIPKSGSVDFPYTCAYPSSGPTAPTGHNTATANWDATAASTPTGSASGEHDATFGDPTNRFNQTVTITDTFNNGTPTTLGTLTATDSQPFTSATYNYSHTVNVPANGCQSFPNTAKIVETGQHSDAGFTVCGPLKTGALTMGFWHNKNGQAIISGDASTGGVCNLTPWLRNYNSFSDLSATATCAKVASYDLTVFNNASAAGSSMNAMLKAQMLSTALDVYFGGGPGGNKIGAPAGQPVGGQTIDLTQICKMIDGSGGTATCSGTYENASPAFGGATSMTISAMLQYQNTSDPAPDGGANWYGNVKATQQLAKDAFDAINNQVAFGA